MLGLAMPSWAVESGWHFSSENVSDPNAKFHERFPGAFYDDVLSDQVKTAVTLTAAQKHEASVWNLSEDQEKRYLKLMENRSHVYYAHQNVSPIEILGMNARDDQERTYYAKLFATQEAQRLAKELVFISDFNHAYSDLMAQYKLPVLNPFDVSKYSPYRYQPVHLEMNDKLMFFVHLKDSVRSIMGSLMSLIIQTPGVQLNMYFVGGQIQDADIQHWAKSQAIPPILVSRQILTLNRGAEPYMAKNPNMKLPALFLIRSGETSQINLDRF